MKKTYAQKVDENREKNPFLEDDIIEYRKVMEKDVLSNLNKQIEETKKMSSYAGKDFFVVLLVTLEKIKKSIRTRVIVVPDCPSPNLNQAVWHYKHKPGEADFLWQLPGKEEFEYICKRPFDYITNGGSKDLATYVLKHQRGELENLVNTLNGKKIDAIILPGATK